MEVFRLSRDRYARTLSGEGAARAGGRWNSPGVEMVYTAGNRSLAMAEVAVHLSLAMLPEDIEAVVDYAAVAFGRAEWVNPTPSPSPELRSGEGN